MLLGSIACSNTNPLMPLGNNFNKAYQDGTLQLESGLSKAPLKLYLRQAYIRDRNLVLRVGIGAETNLDVSKLVVGLLGLQEGDIKEEQYVKISDLIEEKTLTSGSHIAVPLQLNTNGLTEFQLVAAWGEDGASILEEKISDQSFENIFEESSEILNRTNNYSDHPPEISAKETPLLPPEPVRPALPNSDEIVESVSSLPTEQRRAQQVIEPKTPVKNELTIQGVEVGEEALPCTGGLCAKKIRMKGILVNNFKQPVSGVKLAFGLFWAADGKIPQVPDQIESRLNPGEEELSFEGKIFKPGEDILFKINIGRPVYTVPGGRFIPRVRILDFVKENSGSMTSD